ncbi:MAG TPA: DNA repair protein RadA [Clostridia bacterium]|nr:DNA repair protein RadA [Clostridia bacterium]
MAKNSHYFVCTSCGYETVKWMGKCPSCQEWNTFEEVSEVKSSKTDKVREIELDTVFDIDYNESSRISSGIEEMDRVLGSGIVSGSVILVGGDPGIGKSTILLQLCQHVQTDKDILYISAEESISQLGLRAKRIGLKRSNVKLASETDTDVICKAIIDTKPAVAVVDSIQTVYSDRIPSIAGSVNQIKNSALMLVNAAKRSGTSLFIVGHVTKEGNIAGPKLLEHMVDTVLYFEGESGSSFRILRSVKNRFGSTNEIGVFEMSNTGLTQVTNPSAFMLEGRNMNAPGTVVLPLLEGSRTLMVEIQALVCPTNFSMPRRMASGIDQYRINMLMAVMEKNTGMRLYNYDAYINVAGGIKVNETASDLAVIVAIASSYKGKKAYEQCVVIGEVGLTGEIRSVNGMDKRINEAVKMGYTKAIIPKVNVKAVSQFKDKIEIIGVENVAKAIEASLQK